MEDQCRLRVLGTANDVRGQRQAICRDRVGTEPGIESKLVLTPELKEQRNATVQTRERAAHAIGRRHRKRAPAPPGKPAADPSVFLSQVPSSFSMSSPM